VRGRYVSRLGLVGSLLLLACCADLSAFEIPLRVTESANVTRYAECISGGVPLPRSRFPADQRFALFDQTGQEIACQISPLVVEPDGTLRWILLDFQDDIAGGATCRYVLKPVAPAARPVETVTVEQGPGGIFVDTGRMRLTVSRTEPFGLFSEVTVGGKQVVSGGRILYVQMQGRSSWDDPASWKPKTFLAGPPDSIAVRYAGPLRVTIEVQGRFTGDPLKAHYKAWITTWAGKSRVHVKYKLCNSNPQQYCAILVSRSALELNLAGEDGAVLLGADQPISADAARGAVWLRQGLLGRAMWQDIPVAAKAFEGGKMLWSGQYARGGWIAAQRATTVFVCDKTFWSNPARWMGLENGKLIFEGIAERFEGVPDRKFRKDRLIGQPWRVPEGFWLYDCSHHSSEYLIDFAAPDEAEALDSLARASRNRLWVLAPPAYYSDCEAFGIGRFGSLEDEKACYEKWGWTYKPSQVPNRSRPVPAYFVAGEDNHGVSEADSVEALLLMYVRTGQRGWFDMAEGWARYHMDLQAWRTDGWRWKDGAIWFALGGPQGNARNRKGWNFKWGPPWGNRRSSLDCQDLWRRALAKSCYCHFYGAGLADYYCLTGDPDAFDAVIDNAEQKDDEFRRFRKFRPGKTAVGSIRGFGRGFQVAVRALQIDPANRFLRDLCDLCAKTLWQSPLIDERGFHCSRIGGGYGGMDVKKITPHMKEWMQKEGISFTTKGRAVDTLKKGEKTWKVHCFGGTWQHVYIQNGADLYARYVGDEDMMDFTIAFAQMSAKYMMSPKCHQTWYYTYFDVPDFGMVWDPWRFEHTTTTDGEGCVHSGWYTRFYPDACARGYSWTGEKHLIEKAKEFSYYGSKRGYRTRHLRGKANEVGMFASHQPPKDDQVLSVSRLFYLVSHPRRDSRPPKPITDLRVDLTGSRAIVQFTAPADGGGGRVVRYQLKCSDLPIVPYEQFEYARDFGRKRNWWRAVNLDGEPKPGPPGSKERFVIAGIPAEAKYFAVRSFDDSQNRSALSNVASVDE